MTKCQNLRQRICSALLGEKPDQIPFTIYECMLPQCKIERQLRNQGLCIVNRSTPVCQAHFKNVNIRAVHSTENGKKLIRTEYETPYGPLCTIVEPAGFTSWTHKRLFTNADDYKPLLYLIKSQEFEPNYDAFNKAQELGQDDIFYRGDIDLEPLQTLVSRYMGAEVFGMEWHDNQDEVIKLYEAIVEQHRTIYSICAKSPGLAFNYGGNVVPEIIGGERFAKYYIPHYNEAAEVLHAKGKLLGVHFDANCKLFAPYIARSKIDYIEAFTPAPDTDMTLAEARDLWPDKVLWINFPSSVHLETHEVIAQTARDLIRQARYPEKFIMGITEDIPVSRWQGNLLTISKVLNEESALFCAI